MGSHSFRHEPWAPTLRPLPVSSARTPKLRPPPCSSVREPNENSGSGSSSSSSSLGQGSNPSRAPKRTVRADNSWLNLQCEEQHKFAWEDPTVADKLCKPTQQSFYPPFLARPRKCSSRSEDASTNKENNVNQPVQGSPLRARRANWMVDHGEWRPTLSPMNISRVIPEDMRPQEESRSQEEKPQSKESTAVQPKTGETLGTAFQQRRGLLPATEVAVAVKAVRSSMSPAIPSGGTLRHRSPAQNLLDQDSDTPEASSAPEQYDLTLNDTDDDEQDFFPADPCSAGQATFRDAVSSPPSNSESSCPIRAEQEAASKISPRHVDACCVEKPKATRPRRTRAWRRGRTGRSVIWIP